MASTNFVVSSLPDYVQTNRDLLLKNFGLVGNGTRSRISIQTGVKKDAYINLLELTPTFQDGTECGFDANGAATLTQRLIETAIWKVNMDICPRSLVGKYAEYLVRINATEEELPFEQYIVEALIAEVNKKIENLIWQGDSTLGVDGLLAIAAADVPSANKVTLAGTSAYADILAVYNKMSENTLEKGGEIYVSPAIFRQFMQEMVTSNYFHYDPRNEEFGEFMLPGSDVKVVRTQGLAGKTDIVGTFPKNLVYGCDMESDAEDIDIWYSKDDRVFKVEILGNSGSQIAIPSEVIYGSR